MKRIIIIGLVAILILAQSVESQCTCEGWCRKNGKQYGICGDGPICICSATPITNLEIGCQCVGICRQYDYQYGVCGKESTCVCNNAPISDQETNCGCLAWCQRGGKQYGICGDENTCMCSTEPIGNPAKGCGCGQWCKERGKKNGICGDGHVCICSEHDTNRQEYVRDQYKLTIVNDAGNDFNVTMRESIINDFFQIYPKILTRFHPNGPKMVEVKVDPKYEGLAYTILGSNQIGIRAQFLKDHPIPTGVLTHELMHVVQAYPNNDHGWVTEGIADYVRWKYAGKQDKIGWTLADFNPGQRYTDSYTVSARFLVWLEYRVKDNIVDRLNQDLRENRYSDDKSWIQITGRTVDQLWNDYATRPQLP